MDTYIAVWDCPKCRPILPYVYLGLDNSGATPDCLNEPCHEMVLTGFKREVSDEAEKAH